MKVPPKQKVPALSRCMYASPRLMSYRVLQKFWLLLLKVMPMEPCISAIVSGGMIDGGDKRRLHQRRSREEPRPVLISLSTCLPISPISLFIRLLGR